MVVVPTAGISPRNGMDSPTTYHLQLSRLVISLLHFWFRLYSYYHPAPKNALKRKTKLLWVQIGIQMLSLSKEKVYPKFAIHMRNTIRQTRMSSVKLLLENLLQWLDSGNSLFKAIISS